MCSTSMTGTAKATYLRSEMRSVRRAVDVVQIGDRWRDPSLRAGCQAVILGGMASPMAERRQKQKVGHRRRDVEVTHRLRRQLWIPSRFIIF